MNNKLIREKRPSVFIILSIFNGEKFLGALLESLQKQTYTDWSLIWRDDGSSDGSRKIVEQFAQALQPDQCLEAGGSGKRLGVAQSFSLLLQSVPKGHYIAFCDQDDVWFPDKIERSILALSSHAPENTAALYCSRQVITDSTLSPLGLSSLLPPEPTFPMALTQNVATGCTIMLNAAAVDVVKQSLPPPKSILHDWWSYLLVSGVGGMIITDNTPTMYYRQHTNNTVGVASNFMARAIAAIIRGPSKFMFSFRRNVGALLGQQLILEKQNIILLNAIQGSLNEKGYWGAYERFKILKKIKNMRRISFLEQQVFSLWFIFGGKDS